MVAGAIRPNDPCSANVDSPSDDTSEDAISTNRNSGYFMVTRADARRCVSPICGGYYVKRVNASKTPCEVSDFNAKLTSGGGVVRASIHKFMFGGNHLGQHRLPGPVIQQKSGPYVT